MQEHEFNYFPLLAELDMYLHCRRFASSHVCDTKYKSIVVLFSSRVCLDTNFHTFSPFCVSEIRGISINLLGHCH